MLYLGLVFGVLAGNVAAHTAGIDSFRVFVATFLLIMPALLGARLLYVVSHYAGDWAEFFISSAVLSPEDRAGMLTYLATQYGITVS